jgi:diguanylate cyclase
LKLIGRWKVKAEPSTIHVVPQRGDDWWSALTELSRTLLTLLQQYRWELEEIQSGQFLEDVEEFKRQFPDLESPFALDQGRRAFYAKAVQFVKKEKKYLEDREAELKSMIAVLTDAIASLSHGNEDYHERILKTTQTLSKISQLEDIRKIRSSLSVEISLLKDAVKEQQSKDRQQQARLSESVETLQTKLKAAINRSLRDPLTDLYNREGWDQELTEACRAASVTNRPFTVALVDVDHFKRINDTGGHQVGDVILKKLAAFFKESLRAEDFIARLGGDEFAFVLSAPSLDRAQGRLERLCKDISKPTYNCSIDGKEFYLKISISAGLSLYRPEDTPESLTRRADEALYLAKKGGKNRVASETHLESKSA